MAARIAGGPVEFRLAVQLAAEGDVVNAATARWLADRPVVDLGTLRLTDAVPDAAAQQKRLIFDPIPRVDGVDPSADPLLDVRSAVYLMSGQRRRAAAGPTTA